jgi:hypothetical protein
VCWQKNSKDERYDRKSDKKGVVKYERMENVHVKLEGYGDESRPVCSCQTLESLPVVVVDAEG